MKIRTPWVVVPATALLVLLGACNGDDDGGGQSLGAAQPTPEPGPVTPTPGAPVEVTVQDVDGEEVGRVLLVTTENGLAVTGVFQNLPGGGFHGFHIHENPECDPDAPDGPFATAGDHYAPEDAQHPEHAGDLPSLLVTEAGTAELSVVTDRMTLEELTEQGAAVVVHENSDNFAHFPERYDVEPDQETLDTGDSGDPIACGVIETQ